MSYSIQKLYTYSVLIVTKATFSQGHLKSRRTRGIQRVHVWYLVFNFQSNVKMEQTIEKSDVLYKLQNKD